MNLNTGSRKSHCKASSNTTWYGRKYIDILQRVESPVTWSLGNYDLWRCMLITNYFTLNYTIRLLSNVSRCKRGISVKWCICGWCRDIPLFHCGQTRCSGICCGSLQYQKLFSHCRLKFYTTLSTSHVSVTYACNKWMNTNIRSKNLSQSHKVQR